MKPLILHFLVVKFLHIQTTSELNEHCPYAISNLFVLLMPKQELNAISWLRAELFIKKKKSSTTTRHLGLKNLINVVTQTTICSRLSTYHYSLAVIDCKEIWQNCFLWVREKWEKRDKSFSTIPSTLTDPHQFTVLPH